MAVLFTIAPCGARLPPRKLTVLVSPRRRAASGAQDHVVGVDAVRLAQALAQPPPALGALPPFERRAQRLAGGGARGEVEQTELAQMQHHLRHAAGQEDAHRRMRAVGQGVHDARDAGVARPSTRPGVGDGQAGGVGDGGQVQQEVRRSAARPRTRPWRCGARLRSPRRARPGPGPSGGCTARAERRAPSRQMGWPEGASAVWASARPSASATTCAVAAVPRNWQPPPGEAQARQPISAACCERDAAVREARADRLRLARVLAVARGQRHAAGHDHRGQVAARGERHGHGGQALVAGGHAQHAPAAWAGSARAAAARWRRRCDRRRLSSMPLVPCVRPSQGSVQKAAKGMAAQRAELLRRRLDEEADLPVAGVIAEGQRRAVRVAHAAERAQDQHLGPAQLRGRPAHAHVLRPAEDVAARPVDADRRASGAGCPRARAARRSRDSSASSPESRTLSSVGPSSFMAPRRARRGCAARRSPGRRWSPRRPPRGPRPSAG